MPKFYEWLADAMGWLTGGCFIYVSGDAAALRFNPDGTIEAALPKHGDVEFDSPMWKVSAVLIAQDNPIWQQMSRTAFENMANMEDEATDD